MKIGLSVKIDVSKIEKERLFKGEKGTYLDLTTFIDTDQADQYGNHGFISQSVTKEEREQNIKTPILGNCKVFYTGGGSGKQQAPHQQETTPFEDDSIPF
jgi:hypothetical protein